MNGTLKSFVNIRADAALVPFEPFEPENVVLDRFGFMPWVRLGLSAGLSGELDGNRAKSLLTVEVRAEGVDAIEAPRPLTLYGPGDVIGIDRSQIIRRFPAPGSNDVETTRIAHVEFDRPELPWLFTPHGVNGGALQPWIALVVVREDAARIVGNEPGLPPILVVDGTELPPLDESWAWAHAQVKGGTGIDAPTRLSDAHGAQNLSRLLCPRRLEPGITYLAAVVPTFDCGAQAGLGRPGQGTLDPAWRRGETGEVRLPVYDSWIFTSGSAKDFETLVERLKGIPAPYTIGRRRVDTSAALGAPAMPNGTGGNILTLRTALVSPAAAPDGADEAAWSVGRREILRDTVSPGPSDADLPRVDPRLYARFQRGLASLPENMPAANFDNDWFVGLNTSPADRIVAGIGTRVVQMDQEKLVQAAWAQVGEIRRLNSVLGQIQFGRYVAERLHERIFDRLKPGTLAQTLRPVHGKLRVDDSRTVYARVRESQVAPAVMSAAFRRTAALHLRATTAGFSAMEQLVRPGEAYRDFQIPRAELSGIRMVREQAIDVIPDIIAGRLGVAVGAVTPALLDRRMKAATTTATRMARPVSEWSIGQGDIDLKARAVGEIARQVDSAIGTTRKTEKVEALTGMLVAIAETDGVSVAASALTRLDKLDRALGRSIEPLRVSGRVIGMPPARGRTRAIGRAGTSRRGAAMSVQRFQTEASKGLTKTLGTLGVVKRSEVAAHLGTLISGIGTFEIPHQPVLPKLELDHKALLADLAPARTATAYARARLGPKLPDWLDTRWFDDLRIQPIMAGTQFPRPMYEALADYDMDWLVPGLGALSASDFVTVLETNPRFTEAFLVGLSDEMGRELLWRDYPTDQRGTYFRRFWDAHKDEIVRDIHRFGAGKLGSHIGGAQAANGEIKGRAVLVIKAELIRRYPDAMFLAVKGSGSDPATVGFEDPPAPGEKGAPLFHALIQPDTLCVGFDLTIDELTASGAHWWFMIGEHPTAPRFGLDSNGQTRPAGNGSVVRDEIGWNTFGTAAGGFVGTSPGFNIKPKEGDVFPWAQDSAAVAHALLQSPARAMFYARALIGGN
ncbi:MAG TPA: hypothetical protein VN047_10785 [Sphingopyxis sp.]|uniref:hypothetical protein n=1 Tax=Sphingopyxis sp. TaxID=1908224 RepID=UPI002C88FAE7|nr:hypothetical protein [Sphingopyxis sp.]HWW57365.1 hypothetical protein [Sphingopyxis sp.]